MFGIIAGTGFYDWSLLETQEEKIIETPYGEAKVYLGTCKGEKQDLQVAFLARHAKDHSIPPHLINYQANLYALKTVGVTKLLAINAVGSVLKTIPPGKVVLIDDFLDYTWGRNHTYFTGGEAGVGHVDMTNCYCKSWQEELKTAAKAAGVSLVYDGVYVATQGPRFETRAEIKSYQQLGGTVVGMTGVPEVTLCCELGMCYGSLSVVTNYACGVGAGLHGIEISKVMESNKVKLEKILQALSNSYVDAKACGCGTESNLL